MIGNLMLLLRDKKLLIMTLLHTIKLFFRNFTAYQNLPLTDKICIR